MTKVTIYKKDDVIRGVEVFGHAGYAKKGHDIVCAAVSILTFNTINSIESFTSDDFNAEVDEKQARITLNMEGELCESSKILLKSMELGFKMISDQYGKKYIQLEFKEV